MRVVQPGGAGVPVLTDISSLFGASHEDPAAISTGSSFDPVTRVFTIGFNTSVGVYDGYAENMQRWVIPVLELHPDYTPEAHVLDVIGEIVSFPPGGAVRKTMGFSLLDGANKATADGLGVQVIDFNAASASQRLLTSVASTGITASNGILDSDAFSATFVFTGGQFTLVAGARDGGVWTRQFNASSGTISTDPNDMHLHIHGGHYSGVLASAYEGQLRLSSRIVERGALPT